MNLQRLLHTKTGKSLISILLGIGLASLFRKVCSDKKCIDFDGPVISEIENKIFKHNDKCYKYETKSEKCNTNKKILDMSEQEKLIV